MLRRKRKPKRAVFSRKKPRIKSSRANYRRTRKKFKQTHPKLQTSKRKIYIVLLAIAIIGLIYLFYFSPYFDIQKVTVSSESFEQQELSEKIEASLQDIIGENLHRMDTEELSNRLKTKFKEIQSVEINKNFPFSLEVTFAEYALTANVIHEGETIRKSYIINSIGYIVQEDLENTTLPFIRIKSEEPVNTQRPLIEASKLRYILESSIYFSDKFGMQLTEVEYKPIPRELHLLTERNFYVWLDIQVPFEEQLKKLKKALVRLDIYNEDLEHIDLRIAGQNGEKIIYK